MLSNVGFRLLRSGYARCNSLMFSSNSSLSLKKKLLQRHNAYGAFLQSASPMMAEVMGYAGYDYVVIDNEHGAADASSSLVLLQALKASQTPALIRVPNNDTALIKRYMDLGPDGLIIPMVHTVADAKRAVSAVKYPVQGKNGERGACYPTVRASNYGTNASYFNDYLDDFLLICQCESSESVENIEKIAATDGVDMILIGPLDLSGSLGEMAAFDTPEFVNAINRVEKAVLSNNCLLGGFVWPGKSAQDMFKSGYSLSSEGVDTVLLMEACRSRINHVRNIKKEKAPEKKQEKKQAMYN